MTVKYPQVTVKLLGKDGNAMNLIAITARAIRDQVGKVEADAFTAEAFNQDRYVLEFIMKTVNVE